MIRRDTLRVLIVDDEPLARDLLRRTLAAESGVEVVGECGGGAEAVEAIADRAPDLVFLDIRMPEVDGFDVIEQVGPDRMPEVIFVTAYEEYSLRAFRVHALDYLLKPYESGRVIEAVHHARGWIKVGSRARLGDRLESLLSELRDDRKGRRTRRARRLTVRTEERVHFVDVDEIDWIEADDKTVLVHTGEDVHRLRITLRGLLERLGPERFVRIHRSAAVNVDRVVEARPRGHGDHVAVLDTGQKLRVSRTYKEELLKIVH